MSQSNNLIRHLSGAYEKSKSIQCGFQIKLFLLEFSIIIEKHSHKTTQSFHSFFFFIILSLNSFLKLDLNSYLSFVIFRFLWIQSFRYFWTNIDSNHQRFLFLILFLTMNLCREVDEIKWSIFKDLIIGFRTTKSFWSRLSDPNYLLLILKYQFFISLPKYLWHHQIWIEIYEFSKRLISEMDLNSNNLNLFDFALSNSE